MKVFVRADVVVCMGSCIKARQEEAAATSFNRRSRLYNRGSLFFHLRPLKLFYIAHSRSTTATQSGQFNKNHFTQPRGDLVDTSTSLISDISSKTERPAL